MKKKYEKPFVVVELFHLNESIAACENKVLFGPDDNVNICGDYGFGGDVQPFSLTEEITPFNDNYSCACYYTSPEASGYFGNS